MVLRYQPLYPSWAARVCSTAPRLFRQIAWINSSHEKLLAISFQIYLYFSHRTTNDSEVTNFATFGADTFPSRGKRPLVCVVDYDEGKARLAEWFLSFQLRTGFCVGFGFPFPFLWCTSPKCLSPDWRATWGLRALTDASFVSRFLEWDPISSIGFATVVCEEFQ